MDECQRVGVSHGGRALHTASVGRALQITEVRFPPLVHLERHYHPRCCLTLVLDGGFAERYSSPQHDVRAYELVVKPAGVEHTNVIGPSGVRSLQLEVDPAGDPQLLEAVARIRGPARLASERLASIAAELTHELHEPDECSALSLRALSLQLVLEAVRGASERRRDAPGWLAIVLEYLHDGPPTQMSLEELAQEAGVHPAHLARVFRRHAGCSVGQYLRRIRLERAAVLLRASERSISAIAMDCGFYDQSHFTRAFKRWSGMTPRRFRHAT